MNETSLLFMENTKALVIKLHGVYNQNGELHEMIKKWFC